jgi:hypothetical protein
VTLEFVDFTIQEQTLGDAVEDGQGLANSSGHWGPKVAT